MMIVLASIRRTQARVHVVGDRLRQSAVGYSALKRSMFNKNTCTQTPNKLKKADSKLLLLEISKSCNCSSVGYLKCVQFHNWFRFH